LLDDGVLPCGIFYHFLWLLCFQVETNSGEVAKLRYGKGPCYEKVGLKKGRWTMHEDEILTKYIQANGEGSWRTLPKNAGTKSN